MNIWREIETDQAGFVANDTLSGTEWLLNSWLNMNDNDRNLMSENAKICFNKRYTIAAMSNSLLGILIK